MNTLQYSKRQEERLVKKLKSLGVEIVKHYGDREKDSGDVLAKIKLGDKSELIRFDHKSTRSPDTFTLKETMLPKLAKECLQRKGEDGNSYAAISISFLGDRNIYVASFVNVGKQSAVLMKTPPKGGKHIKLNKEEAREYWCLYKRILKFNDYTAYLYELSRFVYWVKESL